MKRPEIVEQVKRAIHSVDPTATAILYGSEARGEARPDSDIDVLVLYEGERDRQKEDDVSGALYDVELRTGVIISPMTIRRYDWEHRPFVTPFYLNVMREGVKL